jgi:hypothetical protein
VEPAKKLNICIPGVPETIAPFMIEQITLTTPVGDPVSLGKLPSRTEIVM